MYEYRATVVSVYDGDSATFDADLGFYVHLARLTVRLAGINAPELVKDTLPGIEARDFLRALIPVGSVVTLTTYKDRTEKYGRYLGVIVNAEGIDVNDLMVSSGHAVVYMPVTL